MILLTVGTQFPFDRLVRAVDDLASQGVINEQVFAQIGTTSYRPRNFTSVPSLEKETLDKYFKEAAMIISHAGMGTIATAMQYDKALLVMPRLKKYGEVVNDHQVAIARRFEKLGYLLAAYQAEELPEKIRLLRTFVPRKRRAQPELVAERITRFLKELTTEDNKV
jgi:UDP-N-acetylglucosamine transferase subunit ALG13